MHSSDSSSEMARRLRRLLAARQPARSVLPAVVVALCWTLALGMHAGALAVWLFEPAWTERRTPTSEVYLVDLLLPAPPSESAPAVESVEGPLTPSPAASQGREPKLISPVKRAGMVPASQNGSQLAKDVYFGSGLLKQGNEVRMTLRALGAFDYTQDDYVGVYRIALEDRLVCIADGRARYGRLLLYDSKAGRVRSLREFSKYIYTFGPSFSEDEPVLGSVTFFPKKEFERVEHVDAPGRILFMDDEPIAKIGSKVSFRESIVAFESGGRQFSGVLVLPPGDRPAPVAVLVRVGDESLGMAYAMTRVLALHGLGGFLHQPVNGGDAEAASTAQLAQDAARAVERLRQEKGVEKVGLLAVDQAAPVSLAAAQVQGRGRPDFLVAALSRDEDAINFEGGGPPSLCVLLLAGEASVGSRFGEALATLRAASPRPRLELLRLPPVPADGEGQALLRQGADLVARLAAEWVLGGLEAGK